MSSSPSPMQRFRDAVEARDMTALAASLAEDIEFKSPAVFKPYHGRTQVAALITKVASIFEDFRYVSELRSGDEVALVFHSRVGDRQLEGVDFARVDPTSGLVTQLTVFIRPASGLQALALAVAGA